MLPKSLIMLHFCVLTRSTNQKVLIVKKIQFVSTVKGTFWFFRALLRTVACGVIRTPRASRQTEDTDRNESSHYGKFKHWRQQGSHANHTTVCH